jgi:hypothetical protein
VAATGHATAAATGRTTVASTPGANIFACFVAGLAFSPLSGVFLLAGGNGGNGLDLRLGGVGLLGGSAPLGGVVRLGGVRLDDLEADRDGDPIDLFRA